MFRFDASSQSCFSRAVGLLCVLASCCVFAGCDGGAADPSIRMVESARPDLDEAALAIGHRTIPADTSFNIAKFTSGQEGERAAGKSGRLDKAGATCSAGVVGEGTAWGVFQLGYAFDNASSGPVAAKIRLKLSSATAASSKSDSKDYNDVPTGNLSLDFVVKDSVGVVLRQESLYAGDLGSGAADAKRVHDLTFEVKLSPGRGFYLVLTGRSEVTCKENHQAETSLSAENVEMRIDWKPEAASSASKESGVPVTSDAPQP